MKADTKTFGLVSLEVMLRNNTFDFLFCVGVVYGYKGLLLIFGLFLAYETRSMKGKFQIR